MTVESLPVWENAAALANGRRPTPPVGLGMNDPTRVVVATWAVAEGECQSLHTSCPIGA